MISSPQFAVRLLLCGSHSGQYRCVMLVPRFKAENSAHSAGKVVQRKGAMMDRLPLVLAYPLISTPVHVTASYGSPILLNKSAAILCKTCFLIFIPFGPASRDPQGTELLRRTQ